MPIESTVQDDVFESELPVVFALNTEGYYDSGFAGYVCKRWPELKDAGPQQMGAILSRNEEGEVPLHGVVCHSLSRGGGWDMEAITKALDTLADQGMTKAAVVWMGTGLIGVLMGVDPETTKAAIHASKLPTVLYHL